MANSPWIEKVVYALGETVLDLITDDNITFRAVPGGSMFNAAVSLGRSNVNVQLISEYGNDNIGEFVIDFLKQNRVQSDFMIFNSMNKNSLALAFLDKNKNPSFSFYHDYPVTLSACTIPDFSLKDILLFGSFYAVKPERQDLILNVLKKAVAADSIIYYDLNVRKAHLAQREHLMSSYLNNMSVATFVKGSEEDFQFLFGITEPEQIYEKVKPYCRNLIVTRGEKPLRIFMNGYDETFEVNAVKPISSVGAGDNFNAGFIYGLYFAGADRKKIQSYNIQEISRIVRFGMSFASEACSSIENYIPVGFEPKE